MDPSEDTDLTSFSRSPLMTFFLLAAAWVDPGGTPFRQPNKGVKDAMVASTTVAVYSQTKERNTGQHSPNSIIKKIYT